MAGDTLGLFFRITNWGESHGPGVGVVVEGCPPKLKLSPEDIQLALNRRRPGQSHITTARDEKDQVQILSGVYRGQTTGTPISLAIFNQDQRSKDYTALSKVFRPSHADYTYSTKYGIRDPNGGGRSSARTTTGSVAAGAIAEKILDKLFGAKITAYVQSIKHLTIDLSEAKQVVLSRTQVDKNIVRCPEPVIAEKMIKLIEQVKKKGDSVGGVIQCVTNGLPVGLGEPIYDKLEADLAKAILSINACKGFEIGSGFQGTSLLGSEHNDEFILKPSSGKTKKVATRTNHSGGVQGGLSNGMPLIFRAAFKPTATIIQKQNTVNIRHERETFTSRGRHDPCVLPRAVPIVEAMTAIILADHALRHRGQIGKFKSSS